MRGNVLEATAGTLARAVPALDAGQTLEQALAVLVQRDRSGLQVVTTNNGAVLGWLTHRDVLAAYNTRLQRAVQQFEEIPGASSSGVPSPSPAAELSVTRLRDYRVINLELVDTGPPVGQPITEVPWPRRRC